MILTAKIIVTFFGLQRNHALCHRWFYMRISLLFVSVALTVYRLAVMEYSPYDAVFEPLKFYRIVELVFVRNFMTHLKEEEKGLSKKMIEEIIRAA